MEVRDVIERDVRDAVRRLGADPLREAALIASLIDDAATQHAGIASGDELDALARDVRDSICGFGPLQRYFDDPLVEEIWINEPGKVFVARAGRSELTTTVLSEATVKELVERMLQSSGRRLDLSTPFVDARLPDGSRLHVAIPDVTREHWAVNIRRFALRASHVEDLVATGTLTQQAAAFLEAVVISGLNVMVAGGTQAGKTTLLNALLGCVPARERIISCEEVFEIFLQHPDWVAMQTRDASLEGTGQIPLRRLVVEALRMRPTRLVVGEVRQAEALDLLIAMNSGVPAMATIHANSCREAVTKLCTLPLLAGGNVSADFVVPTVAGAVDIVVHTRTTSAGDRRVSEIVALSGRVEGGVVETAELFATRRGVLTRSHGFPPHVERFEAAGFDVAALLQSADEGRAA